MNPNPLGPTESHWAYKIPTPFSISISRGDQVYVSGQQTLGKDGEVLDAGRIAKQTRNVFENMKRTLANVGLGLEDLVRLNTYYVYDGPEEGATTFWEEMTRVRLEYFPNPGPAATAVRIKGMPYAGQLIQIEGIAVNGDARRSRQRIMPEGSWDWSIAVPLSQGWKVGDHVYVGGQISADEAGRSVDAGDLDAQTRNIYGFIGNVLKDAGASFDDVVHIKICFKHDSKTSVGQRYVDRILDITREYVTGAASTVTSFGVDLLYPGLELEIDAMAIVDPDRSSLQPIANSDNEFGEFPSGVVAGSEVYVGGQTTASPTKSAPSQHEYERQIREVYEKLNAVLRQAGTGANDIKKLNLFFVGDDGDIATAFHASVRIWAEMYPGAHPAMTPVRVHELARPGLLFQADCIALTE